MKFPRHPAWIAILPLCVLSAAAIEIRTYNSAVHDRFTGYPSSPVMNPTFLYDPLKFCGVGWNSNQAHKQFALVSPIHILASQHNPPGNTPIFKVVAPDGSVIQRNITGVTVIPSDDPGISDLALCTLASPLPASVKPFPYLNLPDHSDYVGLDVILFGHSTTPSLSLRAGHSEITDIGDLDVDGPGVYGTVWLMEALYPAAGTDPNDAYVTPGDSGGPSLSLLENGQPALVGVHFFESEDSGDHYNYDTFVPAYVPKLDPLMAPAGYRMRPAIFTPTTLSFTPSTTPANVFHIGEAASLDLALENTGATLTGNFAVTLTFPIAEAPATVTASGCVVESVASGVWSIRKATVAPAEDITITASWTTVPNLLQITGSAVVESDTTTTATYPLSIPAAETFSQWAVGLDDAGQNDDPDGDGSENVLEYAFGSDPESGFTSFPGGEANCPRVHHVGSMITLSYPERVNANLLGLSYQVEMTPDFAPGPWSLALPGLATSTTQPFSPAIPGFVKRVITWPRDTFVKGVRVRVTLAE